MKNDFLDRITGIIQENISNEQFGVSELAREMGMSRSNLLRKVNKEANVSVSQYIRHVRLKRAMELLKETSYNVTEVSYQVGFNSTSYFVKCFRDYYGYPPGETGKRKEIQGASKPELSTERNINFNLLILIVSVIMVTAGLFIILKPVFSSKEEVEKSIAVLPFKNDSNDSTNIYLINGLMESILTNLQNIEDLRVISRTSVEKYRNSSKRISEIAEELNVNYFIEGSGQKIGDKILLNIQLIEASSDKHLWAKQYNAEVKDIFKLQMDVARNIADEVEAIITPEEAERIAKVPTDNIEAYDFYLKGMDLLHQATGESLTESIEFFKKAIALDSEFAQPYALLAITYYFLEVFQTEKKYTSLINDYADKALLYDSKLAQSLIAKALFYMSTGENELAVPFLEKALEYNPNSALVINTLSDFYTSSIPNTEKYLEYALKGIRLDIASNDSISASYICLHLSNALIQTGFTDEAIKYINKSLEYNPYNLYSEYVKAYILYAKNKDMLQLKNLLFLAMEKDSTRLDILQEVAKIHYLLRDYEGAYTYYKEFLDAKKMQNIDLFVYENAKIGNVFRKLGFEREADSLLKVFKSYADNDNSIYGVLNLAMYDLYMGNLNSALNYYSAFSRESNFHYWILLFMEQDPLMDPIKDLLEFKKIQLEIERNFWENHKRIEKKLKAEGLL